jgi:hypothetical protein
MTNSLERITLRFDGLDSDEHKIDLHQLGESLQGLARISDISGHFVVTHKYSKWLSTHDVRVFAKEARENCFSIDGVLEFVKQQQVFSGFMGAAMTALVAYILAKNANKEEQSEKSLKLYLKALHDQGHRDQKTINRCLDLIEKMATDLRPSAKQAVAPIGKSASTLTLLDGEGKNFGVFNEHDAEQIRKPEPNELTGIEKIKVRFTELDKQRGTAKVHLDGMPTNHRISALVHDPLVKDVNNVYSLALASDEPIYVQAKLQYKSGELSKLYIFDSV